MSDQTPNSSDNLNGSDPSMEDILASIRKIISDDEPVAMESPEDIAPDAILDVAAEKVTDVVPSELGVADFNRAEGESVDLNIDDVLAGLDDDVLASKVETVSVESVNELSNRQAEASEIVDDDAFSNVLDDVLEEKAHDASLEAISNPQDADDDILSLLGEEIPLEAEGLTPELVAETPAEIQVDELPMDDLDALVADVQIEETVEDAPDDIDALLNGLLGDDDPLPVEDIDVELDEAGVMDTEAEPTGVGETEDLELVKSLMADLSDDPATVESEDDLEALLSIPIAEDTAADALSAEAAPEDDILGEILDMTLEDELETHPEDLAALEDLVAEEEALTETAEPDPLSSLEDVLAAEQENIAENADIAAELSGEIGVAETVVEESPSLSDIAAAAEADAVAVETAVIPPVAATAGIAALAGGAAIMKKVSDEAPNNDVAELQVTPTEITTEPTPEPIPHQEIEMPIKAVKTDAILDDVTEAATAGAFAELNQVVEDKAIFNERGPRIGDLVQEALRPMLKEWLDANLKGIVERAVTKEVKRISKGQ